MSSRVKRGVKVEEVKLLKTGIKVVVPVQANGKEKSQDDEGEESEM